MRFRLQKQAPVFPGLLSYRIVKRFLWLPLTIDGETRWLERACWREKWDFVIPTKREGWGKLCDWQPEKWL